MANKSGILHYDESNALCGRTSVDDVKNIDLNHHFQSLLETARLFYPNQNVVVEVCVGPLLANTSPLEGETHQ